MPPRKSVAAEEFVRAWQGAEDMAEVARKLGLKLASVKARGYRFRKKSVPLETFGGQGRPPVDWEALEKLAKDLAPKK
jgi:hypothetical protein